MNHEEERLAVAQSLIGSPHDTYKKRPHTYATPTVAEVVPPAQLSFDQETDAPKT